MPDATPLANHECPLCGQPNQCTPAETGSFASSCWCKVEIFPPELLALIAPEQRNKSCICQQCVNRFHVQHPHQSIQRTTKYNK